MSKSGQSRIRQRCQRFMIKSPVTARDSVNPVSLRINFSVVTTETSFFRSHCMPSVVQGSEGWRGGDAFICMILISVPNNSLRWILLFLLYQRENGDSNCLDDVPKVTLVTNIGTESPFQTHLSCTRLPPW